MCRLHTREPEPLRQLSTPQPPTTTTSGCAYNRGIQQPMPEHECYTQLRLIIKITFERKSPVSDQIFRQCRRGRDPNIVWGPRRDGLDMYSRQSIMELYVSSGSLFFMGSVASIGRIIRMIQRGKWAWYQGARRIELKYNLLFLHSVEYATET